MKTKSKNPGFSLIMLLIVLAVVGAAGYFGYKYWNGRNASHYEFETAPVTNAALTQSVTANGTLNPVINVQVGSQVSGNIQKLYADWNSQVKAGQVVAQIDPSVFQAAVTQAEGTLANSKAALVLAQIQLKRTQDLRAKDSTPQANLDQAIATVDQAAATVKTNEGSLQLAKANLDHCSIISPVDGIVITRSVDVGQTVAAGLNAPVVFVIANDLSKMQIDTNVSEADVGGIVEGQDVDFLVDAYPYTTFHGKVVQVRNSPTTVQNVVTYDAVIGVSNPESKLKPGMTANLSIIIAHRDETLQIPNAAFRVRMPDDFMKPSGADASPAAKPSPGAGKKKKGGDPALRTSRTVYVLNDGEKIPKAVKIKIGISDGITTEVTEGLKEGDNVVTSVYNTSSAASDAAAAAAANPFAAQRRGR